MRIGFDATALPARPVGAGKYIIELVRALAECQEIDELVIFAHQARIPLFGIQESSKNRFISVQNKPVAMRLAWEQVILPGLGRRYAIDLLHAPHYTMPWFAPFPVVTTFHDMTFFLFPELHTQVKRLLFPTLIKISAKRASAIITDSETTRQDALRLLKMTPQKITTVHLGVSPGFCPLTDNLRLDPVRRKYNLPEKFILYVGAIEPRKNLPLLVRAFKEVSHQTPDWHLVMVGRQGWGYGEVLNDLHQLDLANKAHFVGYVPEEELPAFYSLAGMFVYPSTYEGFGLPVLEAMACGTPVITTQSSSMAEIASGVGVLVPPLDQNELVAAIQFIIQNPEKGRDLAGHALERAATFTWNRTAAKTADVYRQTLESNPIPPK